MPLTDFDESWGLYCQIGTNTLIPKFCEAFMYKNLIAHNINSKKSLSDNFC